MKTATGQGIKRKRGRPKGERYDKIKRMASLLNVGIGTAYHSLAGTRGFSYLKAKDAVALIGGNVELWMGCCCKDSRRKLFDDAEI